MVGIADKKLKASSLLETIVALMVIMIVFGIAMTIYVNVMKNSSSLSEVKASLRLDVLAKESKEKKAFFDEDFEEENIDFEKRVTKYQNKEGLLLLELEARDKTNRILAERKEIIVEEAHE